MVCRLLVTAVLVFAFAGQAHARWWIVRASDDICLVVDIEPTGDDKGVTKLGKDVYQTSAEAEADVKELCKDTKPAGPKPSEPENAE